MECEEMEECEICATALDQDAEEPWCLLCRTFAPALISGEYVAPPSSEEVAQLEEVIGSARADGGEAMWKSLIGHYGDSPDAHWAERPRNGSTPDPARARRSWKRLLELMETPGLKAAHHGHLASITGEGRWSRFRAMLRAMRADRQLGRGHAWPDGGTLYTRSPSQFTIGELDLPDEIPWRCVLRMFIAESEQADDSVIDWYSLLNAIDISFVSEDDHAMWMRRGNRTRLPHWVHWSFRCGPRGLPLAPTDWPEKAFAHHLEAGHPFVSRWDGAPESDFTDPDDESRRSPFGIIQGADEVHQLGLYVVGDKGWELVGVPECSQTWQLLTSWYFSPPDSAEHRRLRTLQHTWYGPEMELTMTEQNRNGMRLFRSALTEADNWSLDEKAVYIEGNSGNFYRIAAENDNHNMFEIQGFRNFADTQGDDAGSYLCINRHDKTADLPLGDHLATVVFTLTSDVEFAERIGSLAGFLGVEHSEDNRRERPRVREMHDDEWLDGLDDWRERRSVTRESVQTGGIKQKLKDVVSAVHAIVNGSGRDHWMEW